MTDAMDDFFPTPATHPQLTDLNGDGQINATDVVLYLFITVVVTVLGVLVKK
jgi:hypothetical protein